MENFDWQKHISPNIVALRMIGLWPKNYEIYKLNFYSLYALLAAIIIIVGHNMSQIIYICHVYADLKELIATIFVSSTNFLAAIKMCFYVRNLALIKRLLVILNSFQFRPKHQEQVDLVEPSLKFWRILYFWYSVVVYSIVCMWCLVPILNGWIRDYRLPFPAWYPFNTKVLPNYVFLYLYQIFCIWPITIANLNLDTIVMAFMMFIWCQCDLLCDDLKNLGKYDCFKEKLVNCIQHHKAILEFAEDSNVFFNMIVFGQMITSTAALALSMFQLSQVNPVSGEGLNLFLYIAGLIMQILLYCWFGNEVGIRSSQIPWALYESNWISQDQKVKKIVLILCTRCQEPINITAIKLFPLSLKTFIGILRSAWSYFAVLYNVGTEN